MKEIYRQTAIGKIPEDWQVVQLENIVSLFHTGIWGEDPTPNLISYPVVRSTEITHDSKIDVSTVAERKVPENKVTKYKLQDGDIILVASSGSPRLIGRAALFKQPDDGRTYLFSNFMVRIRPHNVDSDFVFYWLNSSHYYRFLQSFQQTSTGLRNLPKKGFKELKVPLPLLPEQQKIAEILSTVDKAIEKMDKVIEKTERLKKGLMQELLTKGIGHKEFKDTKIGKIPKEWEMVRVVDLFTVETGTTPSTGKNIYWNDGSINWFTPTDLSKLRNEIYIEKSERKITEEAVKQVPMTILPVGSLILSTRAPVGYIAVLTEEATFNQGCKGFIPRDYTTAHSEFYCYYFQNKEYLLQMQSAGSTFKELAKERIENFQIPQLSSEEQKEITEVMQIVDKQYELLQEKKQKFEKIKKGLMNDLLTGKRRVKV